MLARVLWPHEAQAWAQGHSYMFKTAHFHINQMPGREETGALVAHLGILYYRPIKDGAGAGNEIIGGREVASVHIELVSL